MSLQWHLAAGLHIRAGPEEAGPIFRKHVDVFKPAEGIVRECTVVREWEVAQIFQRDGAGGRRH